jgi:hypothetical protein
MKKNEVKLKHLCKSCKWFWKGRKVAHSHCDNPGSHRYDDAIKHNGYIEACIRWEPK